MKEEKCECDFGSVEYSVSLFESVHLLDVMHEIAARDVLHHKVQSIRRLKTQLARSPSTPERNGLGREALP